MTATAPDWSALARSVEFPTDLMIDGRWTPGAGRADWTMWLAFVLTQAYVLARLVVKLQFLASQTALFQASLAHAAYAAAPKPEWPQSPAAELISS